MTPWGLVGRCGDHYEVKVVTLQNVDIQVSIRGFVARVSASLTYHNATDNALEVEYCIPIDEGAAVYKFEAVVNDRKITAHCMEKKKAEGVYKEAVKSGRTAVLAREDNLTSDVFHLALGNLPAGAKAELKLSMIMELKVKTDGAVSFVLPSVLNPRYCPADISPDEHTQSVASSPVAAVVSRDYALSIQATVQGGHSISRLISHSDPINVTLSDDALSAKVTQDGGFKSDHDWSMLLYYSNPYKTHVIRETGDATSTGIMRDDLIMVNLHPEIPEQSYSNKNEVIFVVDRSGSMEGENMQSARATLLLFLKSLPAGCYFNIISFGSSHSFLFPKGSKEYTEETLQQACALHERMAADMGGTEILQPLKEIYSRPPISGFARQILVLSDGQVFNVDQVNQLVSRHADKTRVFAVGIGDGASTALINGLARAGKGRAEMVYQQDKLQLKVMGLVRSMLQDCVQNVQVIVVVEPPGGLKLLPKVPPVIFGGQHLILYTRVPPSTEVKSITIKGVVGNELFNAGIEGAGIVTVHDEDKTLHRLAARAQINQWQIDEEEDVAEDMIALSLVSGVVSRQTALVGVDQDMIPVANPSPQLPQSRMGMLLFGGAAQQQTQLCGQSLHFQRAVGGAPSSFTATQMGGQSLNFHCAVGSAFGASSSFTARRCLSAAPSVPSPPAPLLDSTFGASSYSLGSCAQSFCFDSSVGSDLEESSYTAAREMVDLSMSEDEEIAVMGSNFSDEKASTLMDAVNLQKFDGSWTLKDAAKLASVSHLQLLEANDTQNEVAWATAIVLAFLEMNHPSEKDKWALLANKARMFITGCGIDVESLLISARKVLAEKENQ